MNVPIYYDDKAWKQTYTGSLLLPKLLKDNHLFVHIRYFDNPAHPINWAGVWWEIPDKKVRLMVLSRLIHIPTRQRTTRTGYRLLGQSGCISWIDKVHRISIRIRSIHEKKKHDTLANLQLDCPSVMYKLGPRWDYVITWFDFKSDAIFGFLSPNSTGQCTWFFCKT